MAASPLSSETILILHNHRNNHHNRLFSAASTFRLTSSYHLNHSPSLSLRTNSHIRRHSPKSLPPTSDSLSASPPTPTPTQIPTTAFLDPDATEKVELLENFSYTHEFDHGSLRIRLMATEEIDSTVILLSESFADAMWMPKRYVKVLAFLVKQYVMEKRSMLPHAATVVAFYKKRTKPAASVAAANEEEEDDDDGDGDEKLAGTAEISFNALGMNASLPTPTPPRDCPYICNMTVEKELRRKGIGWHLLNACEELISEMTEQQQQQVHLHCRVIDHGPFNMYTRAGYRVVERDNMLVWLTLQRRKNLMRKNLKSTSKTNT